MFNRSTLKVFEPCNQYKQASAQNLPLSMLCSVKCFTTFRCIKMLNRLLHHELQIAMPNWLQAKSLSFCPRTSVCPLPIFPLVGYEKGCCKTLETVNIYVLKCISSPGAGRQKCWDTAALLWCPYNPQADWVTQICSGMNVHTWQIHNQCCFSASLSWSMDLNVKQQLLIYSCYTGMAGSIQQALSPQSVYCTG